MKMRWFLLPSEAHAALRGENIFKDRKQYQPMFYPRSDSALHDHNRLNRKRLKSGLSSVKFCNCSKQKHRHIKNKDCNLRRSDTANKDDENFNLQDEIDREIFELNKENEMNSKTTQVVYQANGTVPKSKDILYQSNGTTPKANGYANGHTNGHANGHANGHLLNPKEMNMSGGSLPGQIWDLEIALS